ncbi:MAG: DnaJ domain-containing protein, partial [Phycisphaerales bacterium]|nr:DnaJ domain-containing protein [Phycisphaerales bacterium]
GGEGAGARRALRPGVFVKTESTMWSNAAAFIGEMAAALLEGRPAYRYQQLSLCDRRHVNASIIHTRVGLNDFLIRERGLMPLQIQTDRDIFSRGDFDVNRLPWARPLRWPETPVILTVTYAAIHGACEVSLSFVSPTDMLFTHEAREFYLSHLRGECDGIGACLDRPDVWYEPAPAPRDRMADDLKLLGLSQGASHDEVEAAFRDAARRYHPDVHSGRDLPEHVLALIEEHFKAVSAAHDRLRQRMRG